MLSRPCLVGALAALALLPASADAQLKPFGHDCASSNGVRFCPTTDAAARPKSFDGTPIDVDVTLPAQGEGPFPTILLLHGLGQNKTAFQDPANTSYSNWSFAQQGYAVVQPTARGFFGSCGKAQAATPGCEQGFTRFGDIRYEVRDVQTLTGQLVDEGVVDPRAIGATGVSYGGGFSTMLAFLKDRIRQPDGSYAPWTSPKGTPVSIAAAWPRWLWSNGGAIFTRNGRALWSKSPVGAIAKSYANGIFSVALSANVAPTGGDLSSDISLWKRVIDRGVIDDTASRVLDIAFNYHGVAGLTPAAGASPPLLLQSGWTDALFPVGQSLAAYDAVRKANPNAPVSLQFADQGHGPGVNHPNDVALFNRQGLAFFNAWLRGQHGSEPAAGSVTAFTMVCPSNGPSGGGPYTAASYAKLATKSVRFGSAATLRIDSKGASTKLAAEIPGLANGGALCDKHKPDRTSKAVVTTVARGETMIGQPVVSGRVVTTGRNGMIAARLWDLDPQTSTQRLITRGVYRLTDNQKGAFSLSLDGNGWRFANGHRIVVELLGRDDPTYRPSPTAFSARISNVRVSLPVR
jgi:pimeloyl-ACP methyl ester carboxylesterase